MEPIKNNLKTLKHSFSLLIRYLPTGNSFYNPLICKYEKQLEGFEADLQDLYKYLDRRGYDGIDLIIIEKVLGKTRKEILGEK